MPTTPEQVTLHKPTGLCKMLDLDTLGYSNVIFRKGEHLLALIEQEFGGDEEPDGDEPIYACTCFAHICTEHIRWHHPYTVYLGAFEEVIVLDPNQLGDEV